MQKQLGKIRTVRDRSTKTYAHGLDGVSHNVPSSRFTPKKHKACVLRTVGSAVPKVSTNPVESRVVALPSSSLMPQTHQPCLLRAVSTAVAETSTKTAEDIRVNLPSNPLIPQTHRASMPSAAVPETSTAPLAKYWSHVITETAKVSTITTLFATWRTYQAHRRQRRETMRMLSLSCVIRPVDVELRYTISPQKLGICLETPDTQPYTKNFRDIESTLYLQPMTTNMRTQGKELLQWLRDELAAKYLQNAWKGMEIGRRLWQPFG
jgi:hypothetical protein